MDNRSLKLIISILGILLVSTNVLAFGVSAPQYTDEEPLKMYPGQEKEIQINLQNCPQLNCEDTGEVNVLATIEEGSNIAQLTTGTNYNVPYETHNVFATLKITIPQSANIGDTNKVKLRFSPPASEDAGTIQLGIEYVYEVPIVIKSQEEVNQPVAPPIKPPATEEGGISLITIIIIVAIIILVIAIIVIIYWLVKKKRESAIN